MKLNLLASRVALALTAAAATISAGGFWYQSHVLEQQLKQVAAGQSQAIEATMAYRALLENFHGERRFPLTLAEAVFAPGGPHPAVLHIPIQWDGRKDCVLAAEAFGDISSEHVAVRTSEVRCGDVIVPAKGLVMARGGGPLKGTLEARPLQGGRLDPVVAVSAGTPAEAWLRTN